MKTSITQAEYQQLVGIKALADKHEAVLKSLVASAAEIIGDPDPEGGHGADLVWGEPGTLEEFLRLRNIAVERPAIPLAALKTMQQSAKEHGIL